MPSGQTYPVATLCLSSGDLWVLREGFRPFTQTKFFPVMEQPFAQLVNESSFNIVIKNDEEMVAAVSIGIDQKWYESQSACPFVPGRCGVQRDLGIDRFLVSIDIARQHHGPADVFNAYRRMHADQVTDITTDEMFLDDGVPQSFEQERTLRGSAKTSVRREGTRCFPRRIGGFYVHRAGLAGS